MNRLNLNKMIKFLGNPNIFVFSIAWMIVLVIIGTIAQRDIGLYQAQQIFFSSWLGWLGYIPYPSGRLLMFLISFNLLFYFFRPNIFKLSKLGITITHLGALLLMLGGGITAYYSQEGRMAIAEGETSNYIEDYYIKHLTEIEDGLEPYTGHNPNPKERHPSRQYPSATGPIDILCKAKNGDIVVLEIKAHEAKDSVFGQILRYIGHLKRSPLGKGKNIRGIILASDFPDKARYSRIGLPVDNPKDFIKFRKHNFAPLEDI